MTVTEFRRVFASLPSHGWLTEAEALLLVDYASRTHGPILEVGTYYGRSAILLAHLREVLCVDPWDDAFPSPHATGEEVFASFRGSVRDLPVSWFRKRVEEVTFPVWPYRFAYLDGDHSYQGTRNQIHAARLAGAQIMAVHDVNDTGGGVDVKRACIEDLGNWDERVERLAVWDLRTVEVPL